ncbi:unnamed protein product [Tilletia controversa]|uniref:Uncharacterized protein n=4 Tax=Tilletia TaxID=13289 RepID=A0A8X7MKY4_9BASI|nr:hypothetical protein CF336_g7510 [Tilletia laevis]KAE8186796.1 hypothetical protein CF328_g7120 [Tilletia controversa]KAE8248055.1 hypothetical protein A4X03_0g6886 [Tilletia caries]KAE8188341.1 hypothetical protein CF335_g6924 [Tilletia laevis]KAE8240138.1 hypothetical protein A4X06_0g7893 [Tilletia controversa]
MKLFLIATVFLVSVSSALGAVAISHTKAKVMTLSESGLVNPDIFKFPEQPLPEDRNRATSKKQGYQNLYQDGHIDLEQVAYQDEVCKRARDDRNGGILKDLAHRKGRKGGRP